MLDLQKIEKKVDEVLESETNEGFIAAFKSPYIRYAWKCDNLNSWIITSEKFSLFTHKSKLFLKLYCRKTIDPLTKISPYPLPGDVIENGIDCNLKILSTEWTW